MAREMMTLKPMQTATARQDYLGALLEDERRLVLVSVDPHEPWEAFRKMRRIMRKQNNAADAKVDLFAAPAPIEHKADVISLESRRRAG